MKHREAYTIGDIQPYSISMDVPFDTISLRAQVYGLQAEGCGMDNPGGVTAIVANGVGEGRNTNGIMARHLCELARARGIDLSVVTYDDGEYYRQADFTAAVVAVGGYIRRRVADGQRLLWLPHSRGGISLAQGKDELLAAGALQGVFAMATPYRMIGRHLDPWNLIGEVRTAFAGYRSSRAAEVYSGFVHNVGTLIMRPHRLAAMLNEVIAADVSVRWNELASKDNVPVVMAHYKHDGLVCAQINRQSCRQQGFAGDNLIMDGNHARPLVDPNHAVPILRHTLVAGRQSAA